MREKITFFGAGPYIEPILKVLNQNFDLELIVTTEKNPDSIVLSFARENDIKVLTTTKLDIDSFRKLRDHKTRLAVLASFGLMIPDDVLNLYPLGIINVHPSLLPAYRGATPVPAALLNRESITGVSIMKLDSELDHGPLLGQIEMEIEEADTAESLYTKLFKTSAYMLEEILPKVISGSANYFEQDHGKATFTDRLTRESGYIDINSKDFKIENLKFKIRAFYPWPGVWFKTNLNGQEKIIKLLPGNHIQVEGADRSRSEGSPLASNAKTSVGTLIGIAIQVEGKKPMSVRDFANGYSDGAAIIDKLKIA